MSAGERKFVVGTRDSVLARLQTDMAVAALRKVFPDIEVEIQAVKTHGDKVLDRPLSSFGGTGVFVKELEESLLAGTCDFVVHSLKDLPTSLPEGLFLACVLERDDPRDVLVSKAGLKLQELPQGAKVATSSRRRAAQVKAQRADLQFVDIRGNIQTRLRKHDEGDCDGMILAAAGLFRLGLKDRISEFLDPELCTPAAGQGALAIECRASDAMVCELLSKINDSAVEAEITFERAFLSRLGGGCSVPAGALARCTGEQLTAMATIAGPCGTQGEVFRGKDTGEASRAAEMGHAMAESMLAAGASRVIEALLSKKPEVCPP